LETAIPLKHSRLGNSLEKTGATRAQTRREEGSERRAIVQAKSEAESCSQTGETSVTSPAFDCEEKRFRATSRAVTRDERRRRE
jgi:hypothetical protein